MPPRETTLSSLSEAHDLYRDRGLRMRQLKEQGRKAAGYLCAYVPVELLAAAGLVPFRLTGDPAQPVSKADASLETIVCPFVRNCFELSLNGKYRFCDALILPHSCDSIARSADIWRFELAPQFFHFLDVPHHVSPSTRQFFKRMLQLFLEALEKYTGRPISRQAMSSAIRLYNANRAAVRSLYELRKRDPPPVSGVEMTEIVIAAMSLPVEEATAMLKKCQAEISSRTPPSGPKLPRLLIYGAQVDTTSLISVIEDSGARVVMDDLCTGSRAFWHDVAETPDPLDGLVDRYLDKLTCPRTYRVRTGSYEDDLEERFGYINGFGRDFGVNGMVLYIYRCCDPFALEIPQLRQYLEGKGYPVLAIEDDYSSASMARLKTRVQAFIETLG